MFPDTDLGDSFFPGFFISPLYGVDTASNVALCLSKAERTDYSAEVTRAVFGLFSVFVCVLDTMQTAFLNYVFKLSAAD